jgi:hypothetical protein
MIKKHLILTAMVGAMGSLLFSTYGVAEPIQGTSRPRPAYYTSTTASKALKVPAAEVAKARADGFLIVKSLKRPGPGFKADFPRKPGFNEKYYEDWKEMLGYDSPSLVALNDPAPEIKPGTIITPANFQTFPNLRKIMPESQLWRLTSGGYPQIKRIEVQATTPIYHHTIIVQESLKNQGKIKVDPKSYQLVGNYKLGIPFLNPKTGLECEWNDTMAKVFYGDQFSFQTINFLNFDGRGNLERTIRCNLYWMRFMGRSTSKFDKDYYYQGATKDKADGVLEKGAMVVVHPTDIKGFAFVRTRYMDPNRPDYFVAFVPGMRRVRVLSGTDAQDPIFGSELQWDTWASDWQKTSASLYPNDYNLLGEAVLLYPSYMPTPSMRVEGNAVYTKYEKRPVRVVEIISKDPRYYYGYRVKCIDMEHNRETNNEYYDTKGNLWRGWTGFGYQDPHTSFAAWDGADVFDFINRHHTILKVQSRPNDPMVDESYFDLRFLSRQAR